MPCQSLLSAENSILSSEEPAKFVNRNCLAFNKTIETHEKKTFFS